MKAKVIETGEIVNVQRDLSKFPCNNIGDLAIPANISGLYIDENGKNYQGYELDFYCTPINWQQRRYEIAKAAMQGILSNQYDDVMNNPEEYQYVANNAVKFADALINELKKK